jgi:hypothetical protein
MYFIDFKEGEVKACKVSPNCTTYAKKFNGYLKEDDTYLLQQGCTHKWSCVAMKNSRAIAAVNGGYVYYADYDTYLIPYTQLGVQAWACATMVFDPEAYWYEQWSKPYNNAFHLMYIVGSRTTRGGSVGELHICDFRVQEVNGRTQVVGAWSLAKKGDWVSVAASDSGRYMLAAESQSLWVSSDFGASWVRPDFYENGSAVWTSVGVSRTGRRMTAVSSDYSYLFVSNNFGRSWYLQTLCLACPVQPLQPLPLSSVVHMGPEEGTWVVGCSNDISPPAVAQITS